MTATPGPLPTFLVIGAQKSATRWLRHNLGLHPDVFAAEYELAYFNRRRFDDLGPDWYRAQFEGWADEPIVGEATPGYMIWNHGPSKVSRRIAELVPDVRLMAILRDPVDRANSALVHHKRRERIRPNAKLIDLVRAQAPEDDRFGLVTGGWYAASLKPYQRQFGDQLLVLLQDDIASDAPGLYRRALEHIGASTDFVPPEIDEVVFSNRGRVRRHEDVTPEDRAELYEFFRDDIRQLERMFSLDLSMWSPEARAAGDEPAWTRASLLESYDAANAWIVSIVERVGPEQHAAPTGDPDVRVGALLERLVGSALYFTAVLSGSELGDPRTPDERSQDARDPVSGYRRAAIRLRGAMADEGSFTPFGRAAAANALAGQLSTAWELAVATRQDHELPPALIDPMARLTRALVDWMPATDPGAANGTTTTATTTVLERFLDSLDAAAGRPPA